MRRPFIVAALTAILFGCTGCTLDPLPAPCGTWETRDDVGVCRPRSWTRPGADGALGDTGARDLLAAVDVQGRGVIAFAAAGGLGVLEEGSPGSWSLRAAGSAVEGVIPGDLITGPDGAAAFTYCRVDESDLTVFLSERDASGAWREPSSKADAFSFPTTAYAPRLAVNAGGEWLFTWNQWMTTPNYGVAVARKRSSEGAWERPAYRDDVLSQRIFFSNTPVVALNDAGQAIITWYQSVGGPLMAFVSERSGPDAAFTKPAVDDFLTAPGGAVDSDPIAAVKPAIAADGSAAAVWTQENGKGDTLVYIATRSREGVWTKPASLDDSFSPSGGYARGVHMAFGPGGDLYVTWYQDTAAGSLVFAARRSAEGEWVEAGRTPIRLSSPGAEAFFPRLAVGREGGAVVTWMERTAGGPMRVAARRTGPATEPWGEVEFLSPDTGDEAVYPVAAVGPGNRAVVAWAQGPGPSQRVFVARSE